MTSGQETERVNSYNPGARTGYQNTNIYNIYLLQKYFTNNVINTIPTAEQNRIEILWWSLSQTGFDFVHYYSLVNNHETK